MASVLDLDGTVVPERSYILLITSVVLPFLIPPLYVLLLWILFAVTTPVKPLNVPEPIFVNTARPWPFISPITIFALGVPLSNIYFRSAFDGPTSKVRNMDSIHQIIGKHHSRESIVLYDNCRANIRAVRLHGYSGVLIQYEN